MAARGSPAMPMVTIDEIASIKSASVSTAIAPLVGISWIVASNLDLDSLFQIWEKSAWACFPAWLVLKRSKLQKQDSRSPETRTAAVLRWKWVCVRQRAGRSCVPCADSPFVSKVGGLCAEEKGQVRAWFVLSVRYDKVVEPRHHGSEDHSACVAAGHRSDGSDDRHRRSISSSDARQP